MGTPNDTLNALLSGLQAALPGRLVSRSHVPLSLRPVGDLEKGVLALVSLGEGDYANYRGREAQLGRISALLIGHLIVSEQAEAIAVEQAELALAEEIKAFLRGNLPTGVSSCLADGFKQSGQLEFPRGWIVFQLEVQGVEEN
ncbi:MAG: hypothetical protein PHD19_11525 [Dechloromonas sp.]|nr:hypothetical protein [Dechloromonas sp.]